MSEPIDIKKQYQTRSGKPVELISTNGRGDWSVIGYIGDAILPHAWLSDGRNCNMVCKSKGDLVEVPRKHVRWMRVYEAVPGGDFQSKICPTEEDARSFKANCLIAIVRVEFEEGEGLQQEDRHE